jgi:hypothetical protein
MSNVVTTLCWPLQMPPTAKAVLISLADNADDRGICWPSITTISARTCFKERAVQNAIGWLELHHVLVADRSNGRHTRYCITPTAFQPPQQMHPRTTCTPAADSITPAANAGDPRSRCAAPPQQVPSNHQEPPKNRKCKHQGARDGIALPEWLPEDAWRDWIDNRRATKKPMTAKAQELSVKRLAEFREQGHDPRAVIEMSIVRGWQALYAPPQLASIPAAKPSVATNFRGKSYEGTPIDDLPDHLRPTGTDG